MKGQGQDFLHGFHFVCIVVLFPGVTKTQGQVSGVQANGCFPFQKG